MGNYKSKDKALEAVERVVEESKAFNEFKLQFLEKDIATLKLDDRMKYILGAITMGISPKTALTLCRVNKEDFKQWKAVEANKYMYEESLALADAYLESIVYNASKWDPKLAFRLLQERDAKRWADPATDEKEEAAERFAEAAKGVVKNKLTMSEMLKNKEVTFNTTDETRRTDPLQ
jgi:hypothetical protein